MTTEELIKYLLTPVGQVALIMGLAEVLKRLEIVEAKYIPVIDVVLGIISGVVVFGLSLKLGTVNGVLIGIALGLSACGLFSGVKNLISERDN